MDNDKLVIQIDISDWRDDAIRKENLLTSTEDVVKAVVNGGKTANIAARTIAARELGFTPPDILPSNKMLILGGAMTRVSALVKKNAEKTVKTTRGDVNVPGFIGQYDDDPPTPRLEEAFDNNDEKIGSDKGETSYADVCTAEGLDRVMHYLLVVVVGHVHNRLGQIKAGGGNVRQAAEALKAKIDELVTLFE